MTARTIAITGYRRPRYFERLVRSLVRNDLAGWSIRIQLEPGSRTGTFFEIAEKLLSPNDYSIEVNSRRMGISLNPYSLLETIFRSGADCCVYLEEDLLVSPDTTRLADWYLQLDHEGLLALNLIAGGCGSAGFVSHADRAGVLIKTRMINSLGLVLVRRQWNDYFRPNWLRRPEYLIGLQGSELTGWDWAVYDHLLHEPGLHVLQPVLARVNHIGIEESTHVRPDFQRRAFENLPVYAGPGEGIDYSICRDHFELPYEIRSHLNLWEEHNAAIILLKKMNARLQGERPARWDRILDKLKKKAIGGSA